MTERTIIQGDSYALRRPLYRIEFVDENGAPFSLAGCTVRTTYKAVPASPTDDPTDESAAVRHSITVGLDGLPTTESGLYLVGPAEGGVIEERLTAAESVALPLDIALGSDIELTDANGEVFTWISEERLVAVAAYTNRTEG